MNIWYENLIKPPFMPPNNFFTIAWAMLYPLIFISLGIIIVAPKNEYKKTAIVFFSLQLFFNLVWSYLFFNKQFVYLALFDLFLITIFLSFTMKYFYKISKTACYVLVPYLIQVVFAIYLNLGIIIMNNL